MVNIKKIPGWILRYYGWCILGFLICFYIVVLGTLSVLRHNSFASNYDLANADQTVWNTLRGRFFALSGSNGTISRFSIHADIILVLLSPLYLLWDNVRLLILSESVALALGAIPVYLLAQKVLNKKIISLIIAASYLLNPGMQWTDIYDFHAVSFAIPLLLSSFYCAYTKRWKAFFVFTLLALLTKEEISLFVAMIGLVIAFVFKEKKKGLLTFLVGILWFILMVFIVIPHFSHLDKHWAFEWYSFADNAANRLVVFPSLKEFIQSFFANGVESYYVSLLKPFGFLPLLGFPWLLLAFPELIINLLSSHAQMRSTVFHYDSGITPALIIAIIFGFSFFQKAMERIKPLAKWAVLSLYLLALWLLVVALRVNYHYSPLPTTPSCWRIVYQVNKEDQEFEKVLQSIPKDASITASGNVRPHLTHRKDAFTLPGNVTTADYVAILTQQRIVGDYQPIDTEFIEQLLASKDHELVSHIGQFYLFKKIE